MPALLFRAPVRGEGAHLARPALPTLPALLPTGALLVRAPESDRVSVGVLNRDQEPDRTLAVQRRHVRHDDLIPGLEGIGAGSADAEPRELLDAAAEEVP